MAKFITKNFAAAVAATPEIRDCYQIGLRAFGTHSGKVTLNNTSLCNGSVEIDACVHQLYPNLNRWDYCFGYKNEAYFVEVHTANTSEVDTVIRKLQWLKDWLVNSAPELNKIKANVPYYWVRTNKYAILPTSPQARRIASFGLKPIPTLSL